MSNWIRWLGIMKISGSMVHIMPLGATSELDQHPKNTSHHRQVHLVSNGTEARTAASHTLPQLKIDNQKGKHSNLYACICTLCTYIHVWTLCTYIHVWNCIYTHDTCHTYKFCTCVCVYIYIYYYDIMLCFFSSLHMPGPPQLTGACRSGGQRSTGK